MQLAADANHRLIIEARRVLKDSVRVLQMARACVVVAVAPV
jgi:hypothetical protein